MRTTWTIGFWHHPSIAPADVAERIVGSGGVRSQFESHDVCVGFRYCEPGVRVAVLDWLDGGLSKATECDIVNIGSKVVSLLVTRDASKTYARLRLFRATSSSARSAFQELVDSARPFLYGNLADEALVLSAGAHRVHNEFSKQFSARTGLPALRADTVIERLGWINVFSMSRLREAGVNTMREAGLLPGHFEERGDLVLWTLTRSPLSVHKKAHQAALTAAYTALGMTVEVGAR